MEIKLEMIEKADAPNINMKALWQKPNVLQWLNTLGIAFELCIVKLGRIKIIRKPMSSTSHNYSTRRSAVILGPSAKVKRTPYLESGNQIGIEMNRLAITLCPI